MIVKIVILVKSGPCTDEADRALQTAADMLAQGHSVSLYLLQEAVRFCGPHTKCSNSMELRELIEKNLEKLGHRPGSVEIINLKIMKNSGYFCSLNRKFFKK